MEFLLFSNVKGGVYKTSLAFFTAKNLAERGYRVLCLDVDQQAHLVKYMTGARDLKSEVTLANVMMEKTSIFESLCNIDPNLDCVYSDKTTRSIEGWLYGQNTDMNYILTDILEEVVGKYDYVVVDFPPNTNNLTLNAFVLQNSKVIAPVHLSFSSLDGLSRIEEIVQSINKRLRNNITLHKVVVGIKNSAVSNHNKMVRQTLENYYPDVLCPVDMPFSVDYENAMMQGLSISKYLEKSGKPGKSKLIEAIDDIVSNIIK